MNDATEMHCRDCNRPCPTVDGVLVLTDHAEDCAGIARQIITVDPGSVPA